MNAIGTWEINLKEDTVSCSQGMLDLWEVSKDEFNGNRKILQQKVHPDDVDEMKLAIDLAIIDFSIYDFKFRIIPRPGVVKWIRSRGECVFDEGPARPTRFVGRIYAIEEEA